MRRKKESPLYKSHPLYGRVPILFRGYHEWNGKKFPIYEWDLDYAPALPPGAVRGNVRKQNDCFAHNIPKYFYVDSHRTCVQCGRKFTFSAKEQKYWYESLGFHGNSYAIRCASCRRKRRTDAFLCQQIASAQSVVEAAPDDAAALLNLASAIARYHERTSQGDLNKAIACARRVQKLTPSASEAAYWEGTSHLLAGREKRGVEMLRRFLSAKARTKSERELQEDAKKRMASSGESS